MEQFGAATKWGDFFVAQVGFSLHIPARKPSRASSQQELISMAPSAELRCPRSISSIQIKTSWQGGGESESPGKGRSRKCSCQRGSSPGPWTDGG